MTLLAPAWLILLPLAALAGWRWPALRVHEPWRALAVLALTLALAGLRVGGAAGRDVWVLVDQSASAGAARDRVEPEWRSLLEGARGRDDRVQFIDFAAQSVRRERGDPVFPASREATRLGAAVRFALTQVDPARPSRLLVWSDGLATDSLRGLDETLRGRGVPLDVRFFPVDPRPDVRVVELRAPARVAPGAAALLELELAGPDGVVVPWEIRRDGKPATRGETKLARGRNVVRLTDRAPAAGAVRYDARITPAGDAIDANNRAAAWTAVAGRREVLLVSAYADDPVAGVLRAAGWSVRHTTDPGELETGRLAGARLVVLDDVLASRVPPAFLGALDFWVREQGGALLMIGGRSSFGSGGWFQSPIDALLPVSMELRTEHRRLSTALAIALDRSGSMAMTLPSGEAKIDLANAGAARAAELLGPTDLLAVYAVDSEPHAVVPLAEVGPNREAIDRTVRAITSGGGGIFVFNALDAAWKDLQGAAGLRRHVILFADANDAEQPGDYQALLTRMREARATVTVIGLGAETDSDAAFLKDVAARGGGRIFFCADATDLPAVFAQETVAVARAMFVDEPAALKATAGWLEIAPRPLDWPARVGGYNLAYLRDGATAAAVSGDSYAAPLVAYWQRGAGRAAAVAFPLAGEFSAEQRAWPAAAEFVRTLAQWLGGTEAPPGMALRTTVAGEFAELELLLADDWAARAAAAPPRLVLAGERGATEFAWERFEPGRFRAQVPLPDERPLVGAVRVADQSLAFGPLALPQGAEWSVNPARRAELRALAVASGGAERVDLRDVWRAPQPRGELDPTRWLLAVAVGLLVLDAVLAQLGVRLVGRR